MSEEKITEMRYSKKIHISYGLGGFLDNFILGAFTTRIIDFYENEVLLAIVLVGLAIAIYGIWNMINDPILGYLSDKRYKFTEKYGRRYPWYIIGILSYGWVYLLIFAVPFTDQMGMFVWLLITIISFEFAFTLWQANYLALFPDKFRSQKERTNVGLWNSVWGVIGIALGTLIPPLLIEDGVPTSYITMALVISILTFIAAIASIPGMKEDEELIKRQLKIVKEQEERAEEEKVGFLDVLKMVMKDKNFVAYVFTYFGHQVMTVFMLSSLTYWRKYIIGTPVEDFETIISAFFLIAVLIALPIWSKIGDKVGNQRAFQYGTLLTTFLFIPLLFVSDIIGTSISIALIGMGIGAIWVLMYPCFSDVVDDIVINTGERREGILTGIRTFFGRAPIILQGVLFAVVHELTGYVPGLAPSPTAQTLPAQFGIRFLMAIVPMIFYFIGFLLMWKVYDLDMKCVAENKELLERKIL